MPPSPTLIRQVTPAFSATSAEVFLCHLRLRSYSNQRLAHFLFRYRYIVIGAKTTMSMAHDKSNQPI